MARMKEKSIHAALRQLYSRFGHSGEANNPQTNDVNAAANAVDWAYDNDGVMRWRNAADTDDVRVLSVDSADKIELGENVVTPMRKTITANFILAANCASTCVFIARRAYRIVGITEIHGLAEATATTLTAHVEKLTGTLAASFGTTVQSGTFDMKGAANTLQTATLSTSNTGDSDNPDLLLAAGDRLGIVFSEAATEAGLVQFTITLAPAGTHHTINVVLTRNADMIDQHVFVADRDYIVTGASWVHGVKASTASKVMLRKCTGSAQAIGSGTALLTNNTNTGFDAAGTANTVQTGTLTATAASLRLAPGNTLALDFGTTTALLQAVCVITLEPRDNWKTVSVTVAANGSFPVTPFATSFFTADRPYEVVSAACIWSTASATGNFQLTRDTAADAPGAGTDLLSNDSNAGFATDGTAHTTEVATWVDARFNQLLAGDRLSFDGTTGTSIVGLCITVGLKPV